MSEAAGAQDDRAAADDLIVEATPEKSLFIENLVKDIELIPAIMDLVDNSVDGARATSAEAVPPEGAEDPTTTPTPDLSGYWIRVTSDGTTFKIEDNCGGIPLDVALHHAFRFGRARTYEGQAHSVGQFGVGMKRALFKLGNHFAVESRAASTSFLLEVNVKEWADDPDPAWHFLMTRAARDYDPLETGRGTVITVSELHQSIVEDLTVASLPFLREQIRYRHQRAIELGLDISLNGEHLTGFTRELLSGPSFTPVNRAFVVRGESGEVSAKIVAGIVRAEKDDAGKDDGEADSFRTATDAGWWVFCNDRLLLMRERSILTGWGDTVAAYHPQYRQFRGYVWLSAANPALLPWDTTKTGIDEDSRVWRQVQAQMKIALAQVIGVINRLKTEAQTAASEEEMPVTGASRAARSVPVDALPVSPTFVAPPPRPPEAPRRPRPRTKHLQFDVDIDRFNEVAEHLNTGVVAEVGRRTFDYFYDAEIV